METVIASAVSDGPESPQEEHIANLYASYVPHDLKYSAEFEDSLIDALLNSNGAGNGIRVIPEDSDEQAVEGVSVRGEAIAAHSLPTIAEHELPLALNDLRRKYSSPIASINLTHPHGYLEGGPALDPSLDTYADDFLSNHAEITTPSQLQALIQEQVEADIEALKERLRKRKEGRERNEQVLRELKVLTDQHSMELRIQEEWQQEARRKKEAREEKRRGREKG